jgi:hypothetical protein
LWCCSSWSDHFPGNPTDQYPSKNVMRDGFSLVFDSDFTRDRLHLYMHNLIDLNVSGSTALRVRARIFWWFQRLGNQIPDFAVKKIPAATLAPAPEIKNHLECIAGTSQKLR